MRSCRLLEAVLRFRGRCLPVVSLLICLPFRHGHTDLHLRQNFFKSTSFIDFSVIDVQPFTPDMGSVPACASTTLSSTTASSTPRTSSTSASSLSLATATSRKQLQTKRSIFKTQSGKATTSTVSVAAAPIVKTITITATSTVFSTATKSKAGAPACTAQDVSIGVGWGCIALAFGKTDRTACTEQQGRCAQRSFLFEA